MTNNDKMKNYIISVLLGIILAVGGWGLLEVTNIGRSYASVELVDNKIEALRCLISGMLDKHEEISNERFAIIRGRFDKLENLIIDHIKEQQRILKQNSIME